MIVIQIHSHSIGLRNKSRLNLGLQLLVYRTISVIYASAIDL